MRLLGSPDSDLATDLRDYGGALELDYAVRIDVVSAGLSTERASGELAAAAREAMLNAPAVEAAEDAEAEAEAEAEDAKATEAQEESVEATVEDNKEEGGEA